MARKTLCLRYLLVASFIILGISGGVICGTGSYFVHQLHGSMTKAAWYGPPVLFLTSGILNIVLGFYFWFCFDKKFNRPQLQLFLGLVVIVAGIQAAAGLWAIIEQLELDSSISKILEKNLASVGTIDDERSWNSTDIKVQCCGFDDSSASEDGESEFNDGNEIFWSCCNKRNFFDDQKNHFLDTCGIFYTNECRNLALHRYRSVLNHTFLVSLCAWILQVLVSIGFKAYTKRFLNKIRRRSIVATINQAHSRITCPAVQLGAQHVCEGCSGVRYQES